MEEALNLLSDRLLDDDDDDDDDNRASVSECNVAAVRQDYSKEAHVHVIVTPFIDKYGPRANSSLPP